MSSDETYNAFDIVRAWMPGPGTRFAQAQGAEPTRLEDGTDVWCVAHMDLDYRQAYLLQIDQKDYLFALVTGGGCEDIKVEWLLVNDLHRLLNKIWLVDELTPGEVVSDMRLRATRHWAEWVWEETT
jgi:hypothetical protein